MCSVCERDVSWVSGSVCGVTIAGKIPPGCVLPSRWAVVGKSGDDTTGRVPHCVQFCNFRDIVHFVSFSISIGT